MIRRFMRCALKFHETDNKWGIPMKSRRILSMIGLILAAALLLGIGSAIGRNEVQAAAPDAADAADDIVHTGNDVLALDITVTKVADNHTEIFTPEEIGNNFNQNMSYAGVKDVYIYLNRTNERLEDALKNGDITEEEIFFRARQDAREGHCEETSETIHGVSFYTYHYPDYDLRLTYDVFKAPNGKSYPVSRMSLYRFADVPVVSPSCVFADPETGRLLNEEDWGLTFELSDVTSHGATVTCTQSGGQQIGQLKIDGCYITPEVGTDAPDCEAELTMDGTCQFTIDWSESYGELPSGTYHLMLWVYDVYDESQLNPLVDKFQNMQLHDIEFTIP